MIRKAAAEDIDSILAIEEASLPKPWSRRSFESELFKVSGDFLVYEQNGHVAGYIVFWRVLDEAELADIAVAEDFRRHKIAERLLDFCIRKNDDIRIVYLEVEKENKPAVNLYRKLGFIENGEIKDYYGLGRNALRMSLLTRDYRGD